MMLASRVLGQLVGLFVTFSTISAAAAPPTPLPGRARDAAYQQPVDGFAAWGQADLRYEHAFVAGDEAGRFDMQRAELGVAWSRRSAGLDFVLQLDAIRSAGPDSVFGIAGDAVVLTLARAYAAWRAVDAGSFTFDLRAGFVPDPWNERLEVAYRLRSVRATGADAFGLIARNDAGAVVDVGFPDINLDIRLAVLNGEGGRQVELDRAKTWVAMAAWHTPLTVLGDIGLLDVLVSHRSGTAGSGSGRADRTNAAITFDHPHVSVGVEGWLAAGNLGRPDVSPAGVAYWVAGDFGLPVGGAFFRYDYHIADRDTAHSDTAIFTAGLYADLVRDDATLPRLRAHLGYRAERLGSAAAPIAGLAASGDADTVFVSVEAIGVMAGGAPAP